MKNTSKQHVQTVEAKDGTSKGVACTVQITTANRRALRQTN